MHDRSEKLTPDAALDFLVQASRVNKFLRSQVQVVEDEVARLRREREALLDDVAWRAGWMRRALDAMSALRDEIVDLDWTLDEGIVKAIEALLADEWGDDGEVVLDPFADLHGRDAIGIDIDERNRDMYDARRAECAKALFGTQPELPGQIDMFGDAS